MFSVLKRFFIILFSASLLILVFINFIYALGMYDSNPNTYFGFTSIVAFLNSNSVQRVGAALSSMVDDLYNLSQSATLHILSEPNSVYTFFLDLFGLTTLYYAGCVIYDFLIVIWYGLETIGYVIGGLYSVELPTTRIMLNM